MVSRHSSSWRKFAKNIHVYLILLIVGLGIVAIFNAFSIGDPLCGPESCNDLSTVKKCDNTQYCISNVWSKKDYSGKKNEICQICLEMVKMARDQLETNETQTEIKEVFEGSCKLLIFKPVVKKCIKLVDEFEPILVAMIMAEMDPRTVCSLAQLCFPDDMRKEQLESNECVTCQKFVTSAAEIVVKSPESDLMNQLIDVCRSMSSYSDACMFYLLRDPISIMNLTRTAILSQPCEGAGFCPRGATRLVEKTIGESARWEDSKNTFCSLCPAMMGNLHALMDGLGSDGNLIRWTHRLCSSLSLPQQICKKFVKEHYKLLYSYFKSNVDYDYICTYGLGLCVKHSELPPVWPLLPVTKMSEKESASAEDLIQKMAKETEATDKPKSNKISLSVGDPLPEPFKPLPASLYAGHLNAGECLACTNMFNVISEYISTHDDYVNSILNSTCLDAKDFNGCLTFAKTHGNLFKDPKHLNAEKVCPFLVPLCDGKTPIKALSVNPVPEESCHFCVEVFDSLTLGSPKTKAAEDQVSVGLKEICQSVPAESQFLCNQVAENYLKSIVESVTSDMDSVDACGYLKLCDDTQTKAVIPTRANTNYCQSCMVVVQTIYDEVKDGAGKEEIEDILRSICGELPSKVKSTCYLLVDMYAEELIKEITENLSPDLICRKLRFCGKSANKVIVPVLENKSKVPCSFCMTAVNMIINQLENNKTEAAIRKALDHLCSYMPEEVRDTCENLISEYAEDLIDMIIADFNATEICTFLKLCKKETEEVKTQQPSSSGFNIATNEIWRKYNPKGACHFCQIMEKAMAVEGDEEKGAEEMFGLLTDVCLMDSSGKYGDCANKMTSEIIPMGKKALLQMSNVCEEMKICEGEKSKDLEANDKIYQQIRRAVEECAMCENIVGIVSKHLGMKAAKYDFAGNASRWCDSVPKDKKNMCESMLTSYAPSVVHLLTVKKVDKNDVCHQMSLCDESARTKVNMPVSSLEQSGLKNADQGGDCLKGPSFWCANMANAEKCGTVPHCREMVWKNYTL